MTGRILLAGVLGGIAMFVWASLAHTVLELGNIGLKTMDAAGESAAMESIKAATGDASGLYIAPGAAMSENPPASGPSLFMVYKSQSAYVMSPMQLGSEFALELVQSVILAFLLAGMMVSMGARIGWAAAAGVMVGIATNGSYHVWYGFPVDYTAAAIGIQVVEYLVAGIVIALILPRQSAAA
jgi:hypothetical protein